MSGQGPAASARRPGMLDVARLAGVSHQTVSRVLNEHPSVRPETRARVLEAIATLGYRPNTAARALVTRRSQTIGVVSTGSAHYGPSSTLLAVEEAARLAGYFVSVATVRDFGSQTLDRALEHFLGQGVEGIVIIAAEMSLARAAGRLASQLPVVMVAAGAEADSGLHLVWLDQEHGARLATEHLLGLGHRDVLHVRGPADWFDAEARVRGWAAALEAAGAPVPEPIVGDWNPDRGYAIGRELLARGLPSAVFVANDQMALGLVHALAEAGVSVPGDVSVVGFDDIPGAAHYLPPLTTVRQDFRALGHGCMQALQAVLAGEGSTPAPVQPALVVRASSAPPR